VLIPTWHTLVTNLLWLGTDEGVVSVVLAQLNPFDLVVLLTLSNTVQSAIIGNHTSLSGGNIKALRRDLVRA